MKNKVSMLIKQKSLKRLASSTILPYDPPRYNQNPHAP
jgi:hypothetical protein